MDKEKRKQYLKEWRTLNKEKMSKYAKKYYKENKEKYIVYDKKKKKLYKKQYYLKNKERISKNKKEYNENHKKEKRQYDKIYRKNHVLRKRKNNKLYMRKCRKENINFRILCCLRARINDALKRNNKSASTMFLLGCDIDYLIYHIQEQFKKGMTWDNHGRGWYDKKEWHIHHIKSCALFDLSKPEEQRKCFHYTNLQPLWSKENLKKGWKI